MSLAGPKVHVPDGGLGVRGPGAAVAGPHVRPFPLPFRLPDIFLLLRLLQASGDDRPARACVRCVGHAFAVGRLRYSKRLPTVARVILA